MKKIRQTRTVEVGGFAGYKRDEERVVEVDEKDVQPGDEVLKDSAQVSDWIEVKSS